MTSWDSAARPRVFVGSSSEGLEVARALQYQLSADADVVLWNEGVFALSHGYLETLVNSASSFDYGVFVLRSDDTLVSRGKEAGTTRGNVLFELGLFLGQIGQSRTFAVYDSSTRPDIISDLHGVTFAKYDGSRTQDILSAVGPACFMIRKSLQTWGKHVGVRKLLVMCANPRDTHRWRFDQEIRAISAALQQARLSGKIQLEQELAVRADDLDKLLLLHRPTMLHVSCMGNASAGLVFEDADGRSSLVSYSAFQKFLFPLRKSLECVVFTCEQTDKLSSSLVFDINCAIGFPKTVSENAAIAFSAGFYTAIGHSTGYETAYEYGIAKITDCSNELDHPTLYTHVEELKG